MSEPISVSVSSGVAISAKSTSKTPGDHVGVFNLAADGGTNNASLNVVSANSAFSACEVSGHETGHGTLKISHVNPGPNPRVRRQRRCDQHRPASRQGWGDCCSRHLSEVHHRRQLRGDRSLRRSHGSNDLRFAARRIATASPACYAACRHKSRAQALQRQRNPWCRRLYRQIYAVNLKARHTDQPNLQRGATTPEI